ncbi:hypothetical protein BXY66_0937 [Shimia isoporae]|uniref:Sulfotransferase family protein n=1 Tax=Shimia isoporae TaxID=647720 RepID=A0A4R1NKP6_9RHOB|nr:hypothetical protein [Shimia isoporae]TCL08896.1 hypothetical protein BXY66_0937 [Shimia isoporae]
MMHVSDIRPVTPALAASEGVHGNMDVILHVGAHMTGVTSLTYYLDRNRRALRNRGLALWTMTDTRKGLFDGLTLRSGLYGVERRRMRGAGRVRLRCASLERARAKELLVCDPGMLGGVCDNVATERLYPAAGERLARMAHAFDGRVKRVIINIRALEDYWAAALAHAVQNGFPLPLQSELDRLVTQPRSWRRVITDIAAAAPEADILVAPFERIGEKPDDVVEFAVQGRFDAPTPLRVGITPQVPHLDALREALLDRFEDEESLPEGNGRWQPFNSVQVETLRAIYASDLAWLRSGAEGLAYLIEEKDPLRLRKPLVGT